MALYFQIDYYPTFRYITMWLNISAHALHTERLKFRPWHLCVRLGKTIFLKPGEPDKRWLIREGKTHDGPTT